MYDERGSGNFEEQFTEARRVSGVMTGVFIFMLIGLLVSALAAIMTVSIPSLYSFVLESGYGYLFLILVLFVMVIAVFPRVYDMSPAAGLATFLIYAVVNGMMLSSIFIVYDLGTISLAFFSAAAMFGVMAVYGAVTKADLTSKGSFLIMGLIGVIVASLLNFFFRSTMLDVIISFVAIAVFLGLTAYDTQRIKDMAYAATDERTIRALTILGALSLYLNFINLFLRLLRLFGRRR